METFPSGHASFASYVAVYACLYMHTRMSFSPSFVLVRPLIQLTALTAAWFTGLSRITDNMHHPSDVLCGFVLGIGGAVLAFFSIASEDGGQRSSAVIQRPHQHGIRQFDRSEKSPVTILASAPTNNGVVGQTNESMTTNLPATSTTGADHV